ncbi:MAG: tetratricopeptide repeat protein [Candidatus Methylomirabilia bacterium]
MRWRVGFLGVIGTLLLGGVPWAAEPVAVLTEIRMGQGEVQVKLAGEPIWKRPQPLLSLRPGDQVRATGDGRGVLVFTGGGGTRIVSSANSPFTVQVPTAEAATEKLRSLVASVTQFLLGKQKKVTYQSLSVRRLRVPSPLILAPRQTRLLPGPVTFEWAGSDYLRYRVRVFGPGGLLWEQANLSRQPLSYPATAPALRAGTRYAWELKAKGHPTQRAHFELVAASEAARIEDALGLLQPSTLSGYPRNTLVLMRAGLLFEQGLYHEARRELLAAMASDPDEPSLHHLLGHLYEGVGLKDLAAQEFQEAQFLSTPKP